MPQIKYKHSAKASVFEDLFSDPENLYIRFCKIFDEQRTTYPNDTFKAINETIRICTDNEILKEYLQKRESEVIDIMMSLFSQEYATKMMILEERQDAEAKAKAEKAAETALKLLPMNLLSINEIAAVTDLPIEKIKELADSLK